MTDLAQGTSALVFSNANQAVTSTLVIASETGHDHASVIKLVRTYLTDFEEFGRVGFQIAPFETNGGTQQREIARLNQEQATLLITYMRNNAVVRTFKKRLVKAFFDFARNAHPTFAIPQTLPDALRLAADLAESNAQQQARLTVVEPKADALDRIVTQSSGTLNLTNAAKTLQVNPRVLIQRLSANRWIYRRAGGKNWTASQDKLQQGVLEHKITKTVQDDGTDRIFEQVLVTAKGLAKLATMLSPLNGGAA